MSKFFSVLAPISCILGVIGLVISFLNPIGGLVGVLGLGLGIITLMKKRGIIALLACLLSTVAVIISIATVYHTMTTQPIEEKQTIDNMALKAGDTFTYKEGNRTRYKITMDRVEKTDYRRPAPYNEPEEVVYIYFTYENIDVEPNIYFYESDFKFLDEQGARASNYFPSPITVDQKVASKGEISQGQMCIGLQNTSNKIKIIIQPDDASEAAWEMAIN